MTDLDGRTYLITGANTGIGRATALELGRRGATLYLACRTEAKTRPVMDEIRANGNDDVHFLPLDLGDLASVRACAEAFLAEDQPLHVLINNAGLAGQRGLTKDGFEKTFGVNHLGHYLLTELLLDRLKESAPARIVNVASKAHYKARGIDWSALESPTKTTTGLDEYQTSKLANVLHAKELARRLEGTGVTTYSLHPGVIASDVWREVPWPFRSLMTMFMKSIEDGAKTSLHCATSEEAASESGLYYDESRVKEPNPVALKVALQDELRERSEAWIASRAATGRRGSAKAPGAEHNAPPS
ncbi:MAG: SDR family oxidoreductase [Sandaracinaceae bacterium]|nr:SDR family oxidoreductase [Sandaracinaceae bacterium]